MFLSPPFITFRMLINTETGTCTDLKSGETKLLNFDDAEKNIRGLAYAHKSHIFDKQFLVVADPYEGEFWGR